MRDGCVVRLDERAAVLAVAAVVIAVALGYWAGAVAGIAAALAGLFSAAVLQVAINRQGVADKSRNRLEAADTAFAPAVMPPSSANPPGRTGVAGGVTRYLRPEAEVVRFWPRPELDELMQWVISDQRLSIQLVTGTGGSGKTRLARQLGDQVRDLGWRSWWIPAGEESKAPLMARQSRVPVLLVTDYAETRVDLSVMLNAAASDLRGPKHRILLLARSAGEWWQRLQDSCPDSVIELIAASAPMTLGPVVGTPSQHEVYAEALSAFANLRRIPCPDIVLHPTDSEAIILVLHAAALLAILEAETTITSASTQQATDDVLSRLLSHERRYWQQSLHQGMAIRLDPDVIERVVAIGCLIGASDQESAIDVLTAIPDLADGQLRGAVARWLHDLYPVTDVTGGAEWIGQLRPDPIAERLVVTILEKHPELISRLFADLPKRRAARAFGILARAGLTQPRALSQLIQAIEHWGGVQDAVEMTRRT